jgi:hypothetical protein
MKEEKLHFTDTQLLDLLDEAVCAIGFQRLMQRLINLFPDLKPRTHLGSSNVYTFRFLIENAFKKAEQFGLRNEPDLVVDPEKSTSKNYYTQDSKRLDWLCTKRGAEWFTAYITYYSTTINRDAIDTVMDEDKED